MENSTHSYMVTSDPIMDQIHQVENVSAGLIASFAIIYAVFKTWNFCRKNAINIFSARTLFWFIVFLIQTMGNCILLLSSVTCLYIFIIYKGQSAQYISFPDERMEAIIKFSFFIAFGAKIAEMILLIHIQRRANIFFIDWEQPQTSLDSDRVYEIPHKSLRRSNTQLYNPHINCKSSQINRKRIRHQHYGRLLKSYCGDDILRRHSIDDDDDDVDADDDGKGRRPTTHKIFSTNIDFDVNRDNDFISKWASVSTWRTFFIANQWLKIATKRKTSVIFQMVTILFILEIVGLKFWSLAEPKWSLTRRSSSEVQENFTFRSAIAIGAFIFVYFLQWLACTLYEIYVKHHLQEFVDLCSLANISIFLLSHSYSGYYIHGRSVHGFADKNLASLMNDLEYEETNQCAQRGLIPGTREQIFIVTVSNTFRACYDAIISNGNNNSDRVTFSRSYISDDRSLNKQWSTRAKVNEFFCNYIDHCLKNVDYTIQDKCFVEKLLNIELANTFEKSTFYIDKNYSFDEIIFHGNEWTLITFELIIFLSILAVGGNWITCALVTITVSESIVRIVQIEQKRQLSKQTLIDRKFFM